MQPFVVANWLDAAEFCVLKVRRDIAEVAYSMIGRRWDYPADAASLHLTQPRALIEGLLRAESVLEAIPGETMRLHRRGHRPRVRCVTRCDALP